MARQTRGQKGASPVDEESEVPLDALEAPDDEDEQEGDAKPTMICMYTGSS